ncbi:MAG: DALR anticodon-binding domain-containing protein, partial [Thiohalophilus sp.]
KLLQDEHEIHLFEKLTGLQQQVSDQVKRGDYQAALSQLAALRQPVDNFFDNVMVMVDDQKLRDNRIALLNNLHRQFLQIADISKLQG